MDTPRVIKILQWNCNSIRPKLQDLVVVSNQLGVDAIVLQETKLSPGSQFRMQGFSIVRGDRNSRGGGVLIALKHGIRYDVVSVDISNGECIAVDIAVGSRKIRIFSVYSTNGSRVGLCDLNRLTEGPNSIDCEIVVLGDFNAHSTQWGGESSNSFGQVIESWVESNDLVVLNDGRYTRLACPPSSPSAIDLSIVSRRLAVDCSWDLYENTLGSDHIPIILEIFINNRTDAIDSQQIEELIQVSPTKVDWRKYQGLVQRELVSVDNYQDCEGKYKTFVQGVMNAATNSALRRSREGGGHDKPWFDESCRRLWECRRQVYHQLVRCSAKKNDEAKENTVLARQMF